jgi:hypothetical protein
VYEQLLVQNPGVARHGEGWTSRNNLASGLHGTGNGNMLSVGRSMGKTTSMMSLREKARAFLNPGASGEKDKRETLDLTTFEHDHDHGDEHDAYRQSESRPSGSENGTGTGTGTGSRRQSGGKMVQWSSSTTTIPTDAQVLAHARPGTPGAISTLSMSTTTVTATTSIPANKKKGLFKNFKWGK